MPRGLFLFLFFPPTPIHRVFHSLSFSRVDYKFSRPPERNVTESPDPRRDCEIEKRCRRTRRADSRPHHGPTPPPTKSPSQGRSPTKLTSYESGRPSERDPPLCCLSICGFSFLVSPLWAPFFSFSSPFSCRLIARESFSRWILSRPSPRLSTLSPVCRVYRAIFSPMLTLLHRFQLRFCSFADGRGQTSLSLSLFLSYSLTLSLCSPFCCFSRGSRASSSRLIVLSVALGPIRIFITHFSPRHSFSEEAPCSVHTRTSHPLLFFVLDSFYPLSSLRTTAAAAVAAVSRMILSIFVVVVASVSHVKRRVSAFVGSPVSLPFSRSTPFFGHSPDSRVHRVRAVARAHLTRWHLVIATLIRKTREWLATVQRSNV